MTPEMRRHLRDLLDRIDVDEAIRRRAVQEIVSDALAFTWTHRAKILDWAAERPGDYRGGPVDWETGRPLYEGSTTGQERAGDLRAAALACRQKAALLEARWIDA